MQHELGSNKGSTDIEHGVMHAQEEKISGTPDVSLITCMRRYEQRKRRWTQRRAQLGRNVAGPY